MVPTGPHLGQPRGRAAEPARDDAIADFPAVALGVEQTRRGERTQVLHHGLARHRVAGGQLGGGQRAFYGQLVEESAARRVRQGGKDGVNVGLGQGERIRP